MYSPLSQFRQTTPLLILMNIGVILALMLLGEGDVTPLWVSWAAAGILTAGIWRIVAQFSLDGGAKVRAFAIAWPIISLTSCFSYLYFPHTDVYFLGIVQQVAMLVILALMMSLWQRQRAILKHMLIGLIIGLLSTQIPHTLLWVLLIPVAGYFMRSWSSRNIFSAITGILFGIWTVYCLYFFLQGEAQADAMITQYAIILWDEDYAQLFSSFGLWQDLFLGFVAVLLLFCSLSSVFINQGSVRMAFSIRLISALGLLLVALTFFDVTHFPTYLSLFSLFLGLQFTIHQANLHSALYEWWILFILLAMAALCILPLIL